MFAATRYWTDVFPFARQEICNWEDRASTIPEPTLRALAVKALRDERGNLEGATAFAAFVPRPGRRIVARAAIAFQAAYDYVDAVSEQQGTAQAGNTRRLHEALRIALNPARSHVDYYEYSSRYDDDGYLYALVDSCQSALMLLPAFSTVAQNLRRIVDRIVTYQHFNHDSDRISHAFAQWAETQTPLGTDLKWWETAAAAGSSLAVFALMAMAGHSAIDGHHVSGVESAYFPWIGSLHTMLDSLVDRREDSVCAQRSLIEHYASREEAVTRLEMLAERGSMQARTLSDSNQHNMILAAMTSFYLSAPQVMDPLTQMARRRIPPLLGDYASLSMFVLRAKNKNLILRSKP